MVTVIGKKDSSKAVKKKINDLVKDKKQQSLEDFFGCINLKFEPVEYQRAVRDDER